MPVKRRIQIRISHLLWCTLVVAAFLGGQRARWCVLSPVRQATPSAAPYGVDIVVPTSVNSSPQGSFYFYIGVSR